jgi:hypothetical protein
MDSPHARRCAILLPLIAASLPLALVRSGGRTFKMRAKPIREALLGRCNYRTSAVSASGPVLINTILVEQTIEREGLWERLSAEDLRALTPLFHGHINPYGQFALDLDRPSHQAVLQQLQRQRHDLLLFAAVSGQLALTAITNKIIGRIPVLDHVEFLMDLMLGLLRG